LARLHRFLSTGEDLPATAKEKTISYWSALVRGSAIKNGHNLDLAEAFMNKEKEVKIGDRVVHPKGAVLTLNAQEAAEKINGKPLLADGFVDSIADLTKQAGLKGTSPGSSQLVSSSSHFGSPHLRLCCCSAEFSERIWNLKFPA
jgi:hypothetical protein